jgi:CAAX protease family protein
MVCSGSLAPAGALYGGLRSEYCFLNIASGAARPTTLQWPALTDILAVFLGSSLLVIALAEEPGFRGFALPRFLASRSALAAALIVGLLHTLWHLPILVRALSES